MSMRDCIVVFNEHLVIRLFLPGSWSPAGNRIVFWQWFVVVTEIYVLEEPLPPARGQLSAAVPLTFALSASRAAADC